MTDKKIYEILGGFPQDNSVIIPFGDQPFYSEGFVVRFFNEDGSSWIANFCPGFTDLSGVYEYPEKEQTLVFAGGKCYLMNLQKKEVLDDFGFAYHAILNDDKGRLITYDDTNIAVVEPTGEIWKSRRISWDGFKDVKIENDTVSGVSYSPMDSINPWKPFSVNLNTKEVTGGSYYDFIPKKSLFSKIKKIFKYTGIAIVLLFIFLIFYSSPVSKKNAENLKKIQTGMTAEEVVAIMGKPINIEGVPLYPQYKYTYRSPGGILSAGDYLVFFYKDSNTVRDVYRGD